MSIGLDWGDDNIADEIYHIMCSVSGGVTGPRTGILKDAGEPVVFYSREEAEDAAARYSKAMNGNPYSSVIYKYWVVEM